MKIVFTEKSFSLQRGDHTILTVSPDKTMIYIGKGRENVDMYRGNYRIEDYLTERRPLKITDVREKEGKFLLNLRKPFMQRHFLTETVLQCIFLQQTGR